MNEAGTHAAALTRIDRPEPTRTDPTDEVPLMPTALIVEDEPEANRLLSMLVQLRGYRTESAYTGGEALEKVQERPPDLVFLDLMLPDINGFEVCKCLKADRATSLIPVIMVTARVAAENRLESYAVGADDYVSKPYTPDQIYHAMSGVASSPGRAGTTPIDGVIPVAAADPVEALRLLGQLRNLLVARTSLEPDAIAAITAALREIVGDALEWARRSRRPLDTALGFHIRPDRLAITLRDASGWLAEGPLHPVDRWPSAFAAARFDEVIVDEPGRRITVHKRYPSHGSGA
jgi:CheY-like chemotaxis protein